MCYKANCNYKCIFILLSVFSILPFPLLINIPPHSGGYFCFGHSPNSTGGAQVRFLLACQPCNSYLLPVNGSRGSYMLS